MSRNHTIQTVLRTIALIAMAACSIAAGSSVSQARPPADIKLPDGFTIETVSNVFELPTAFVFLPDGRILVGEKAGVLKMIDHGVVLAQPVIDMRYEVNDFVDRGFIDVAVDPDFTLNHYIYLFFTYRPPSIAHDSADKVMGHIVRYILDGNRVRTSSAKTLLDDFESTRENHSVDSIRWSPEGYMFVTFGEGAPSLETTDIAFRSQNIDDLGGKIIRIDRETGNGIPGNPFYDPQHPHSARSRVWAYGLRNPFRFAVHPVTGIPYIGDVGDVTYEMLRRTLPGQNYGWPCVEGIIDRPDYIKRPGCKDMNITVAQPSEYDYPHMGNNASITGGDFDFSTNFPASMRGDYFFGDYSIQWMRRAVLGPDGKVTSIEPFGEGLGEIVDIKFGPDGYLYYLSIYSGGLRRIKYMTGNQVPAVKLSAAPTAGNGPLTVSFSANGTSDPDKDGLAYAWNFGDGSPSSSDLQATHVYSDDGQYLARLVVTDTQGGRSVAEQLITVGDATPVVSITSPYAGNVYLPGETVPLTGQATDVAGKPLAPNQMSWRVVYHDGFQIRVLTDTIGATTSFVMPGDAQSDSPSVEVLFSAKSAGGLIGATHIDLYPTPQDGYIRSWWLTSGFPFMQLENDVLPGGEAAFIAKPGDPGLRIIYSPSRRVNLADFITPAYKTVAYAFVWIDSPADRTGLLGMLSDDGIAVWLNNQKVWYNKVHRFMPDDTRDIDLPPITLKKGLNALLVKVDQDTGDWAFKVRVLNPDGSIMQDVTTKMVAP